MARRARQPLDFEVAEGATGLRLLLALLLAWLPEYGGGARDQGGVPLVVGGAVPEALAWGWCASPERRGRAPTRPPGPGDESAGGRLLDDVTWKRSDNGTAAHDD